MTSDQNYIDILKTSLKRKVTILSAIDLENRKQKEILSDPLSDVDGFQETVDNKAKLIEELEQIDEGFETVFDRVKDALSKDKAAYAADIVLMQEYIRKITDKSALIESQEKENYRLAEARFRQVHESAATVDRSQRVASAYYKSMMGLGALDSQYMDKKIGK